MRAFRLARDRSGRPHTPGFVGYQYGRLAGARRGRIDGDQPAGCELMEHMAREGAVWPRARVLTAKIGGTAVMLVMI